MTDEDKRAARRVPVVLRIKLRYKKVDTFISKFATNISSTGMFISSRKPKAIGTELRFELRLSDESPVVSGKGVVKWVREYDADRPRQPHGMGIEFTKVSDESRALIDRIVEHKREKGVEDDGEIPRKEKKKRTRRKRKRPITYLPPDAGAKPIATGEATDAGAPTGAEADPTRKIDASPRPAAKPSAPPVPLEARRRLSIASVDDVIAEATANAGSSNGEDWSEGKLRELLDADLPSMDRALARAKELAGDLGSETELAELTRVSATAVADSVDNASDALSSMLGGTSVTSKRKLRSKRADPAPVPTARPSSRDRAPDEDEPPEPEPEPVPELEALEHSQPDEFAEGTLDVPVAQVAETAAAVEHEPVEHGPAAYQPHDGGFGEEDPGFADDDPAEKTIVATASYVDIVAAQAQAAVDSAFAAAEELDVSIPDYADIHEQPTAAEVDMSMDDERDPGASDDAIPVDLDDVMEEVDAASAQPLPRAASIDAALDALESDGTLDEDIPIDMDDSDF